MQNRQEIAPTTATVGSAVGSPGPVQINTTEADKVIFAVCGNVLATTETILFYIAQSVSGGLTSWVPVYDATGAQASLKATLQSIMLEGGFLYGAVKSATAGTCGLDSNMKPRR